MLSKKLTLGLLFLLTVTQGICTDTVKPVDELLIPYSFQKLGQSKESIDKAMSTCEEDNSSAVTIYSKTGKAQVAIDVKLDGSAVGDLRAHYPDKGPLCRTPDSKGVITIIVPAGKHSIEATSLNVFWPSRSFVVKKCECLLLPFE